MDDKGQLPEGPFGTFAADFPKDEPLLACAWAARSLVDSLSNVEWHASRGMAKLIELQKKSQPRRHSKAKSQLIISEGDEMMIRAAVMGFNRDMREVELRIHQGYDLCTRKFYEDTGVSVDGYVGTCWAEIALQLGRAVYFAIAACTNPQCVLPSTINQDYVPLDPDSVVKSFDKVCVAVCQKIEGITNKGLKQLSVAMLNEHTKVHEKLFAASPNGPTPTTALTKSEVLNVKAEGSPSQEVFVFNGKHASGIMQRMVLDGEWQDSTIAFIDEAAVAALQDVEGDQALTQKIWRARSLVSQFTNLLRNHPALWAVPVESWTVQSYRDLFNDVSTIEREFRLLGDLDSKAHPAFLAFWILSQRLRELLDIATDPPPNLAAWDKAKSKTTATSNTTPKAANGNESDWPVGTGWEFRPGEAAYLGEPFRITGKPWAVLKRLAQKPGEPVLKRILWDLIDPDHVAEEGCVRDSISDAREILRDTFKLGSRNPIRNVAKGIDGAWQIDESVFGSSTKNPRSADDVPTMV